MRVMMIGPYPRSRTLIDGGVAAATMYLSEALAREEGIELIGVRVAKSGPISALVEDFGWPVEDLALGRFSVSTFFRRQRRRFESLLDQHKPDLIHAQGADVSGFLAVASGRPAVITVHGILNECAKFRTNPIKRLREHIQATITERFVTERAKHVIAISPYVVSYYRGRITGCVYDIPNAIAPAYFQVTRRPEKGRLLFAGRISLGKGVIDLIQAIAEERQVVRKLILAGTVPDKDFEFRLRNAISETSQADRVELAGLLNEATLLDEFARAFALVLPSYQETAPMVIQQAMAAGVPVVATRVGGIPDMIEHGISGLLFEPGDSGELGRLLKRLHEEPELSGRLSAAARMRAFERYTAQKVAAATRASYDRVLSMA